MIKKIIFSVCSLAIVFVSCKKDRTCTCTLTRTGTSTTQGKVDENILGLNLTLADTSFSQPINEVQVIDKVMTGVTKSTGKSNCISYTQPFLETNITSVPASSFNISVVVTRKGDEKYDCALK